MTHAQITEDIREARADGYLPRENWGIRIRRTWPADQRHDLDPAAIAAALSRLSTECGYLDQPWGSCPEDWLVGWSA